MSKFEDKFNFLSESFNINTDNGNLVNKFKRAKSKNRAKTQGYRIMDTIIGAAIPVIPIYRYGSMWVHKIKTAILD